MSSNNGNTQTQNQLVQGDTQLSATNIFSSGNAFILAQRMAQAFASSTIVPKDYQGNPANCLIALEMANRIGTAPMMVMQNLYIVNGRPAWSSQFIVAMINASKKYLTELQYELKGTGDNMECYAYALDRNNRKVVGPTITMKMAKAEGWLDKNGSKWKTMPEVMMRYRAASFFGRLNCPDMIMGIYSADEVIELSENKFKVVDVTDSTGAADFTETPEPETPQYEPGEVPTQEDEQDFGEGERQTPNTVTPPNNDTALACADCGVGINTAEHGFSSRKYGRPLCRKCQTAAKNATA